SSHYVHRALPSARIIRTCGRIGKSQSEARCRIAKCGAWTVAACPRNVNRRIHRGRIAVEVCPVSDVVELELPATSELPLDAGCILQHQGCVIPLRKFNELRSWLKYCGGRRLR